MYMNLNTLILLYKVLLHIQNEYKNTIEASERGLPIVFTLNIQCTFKICK